MSESKRFRDVALPPESMSHMRIYIQFHNGWDLFNAEMWERIIENTSMTRLQLDALFAALQVINIGYQKMLDQLVLSIKNNISLFVDAPSSAQQILGLPNLAVIVAHNILDRGEQRLTMDSFKENTANGFEQAMRSAMYNGKFAALGQNFFNEAQNYFCNNQAIMKVFLQKIYYPIIRIFSEFSVQTRDILCACCYGPADITARDLSKIQEFLNNVDEAGIDSLACENILDAYYAWVEHDCADSKDDGYEDFGNIDMESLACIDTDEDDLGTVWATDGSSQDNDEDFSDLFTDDYRVGVARYADHTKSVTYEDDRSPAINNILKKVNHQVVKPDGKSWFYRIPDCFVQHGFAKDTKSIASLVYDVLESERSSPGYINKYDGMTLESYLELVAIGNDVTVSYGDLLRISSMGIVPFNLPCEIQLRILSRIYNTIIILFPTDLNSLTFDNSLGTDPHIIKIYQYSPDTYYNIVEIGTSFTPCITVNDHTEDISVNSHFHEYDKARYPKDYFRRDVWNRDDNDIFDRKLKHRNMHPNLSRSNIYDKRGLYYNRYQPSHNPYNQYSGFNYSVDKPVNDITDIVVV